MKIRYRNFTRGGDSYPWATHVSEELVRKPKILVIWEFAQFVIALVWGSLVVANAESWSEWMQLAIPATFLISALCLALDKYFYRVFSLVSVFSTLVFMAYLKPKDEALVLVVVISVFLVAFSTSMFVGKKAREYFTWCRSMSGHT
ncbi:ABC transporter ATP-binding protein [Microbulbifer mangrovi]|uniref:ABC transporter ATP-binding protein n=1 Tax=Microbulbifer mangrovi TaxID=927787 RepID=UPI00117ED5E3|nr:ABC transporter ATP-binding protein [Microbulbifer mangrovi]